MEEEVRISNLPLELKANIISRLTTKQIIHIKRLSKYWRAQVTSSDFIQQFLRSQPRNCERTGSCYSVILIGSSNCYTYDFAAKVSRSLDMCRPDYHSARVVGCCNGLVCFQGDSGRFWVQNPETGSNRVVPTLKRERVVLEYVKYVVRIHAGFGYDCMDNDYKILALIMIKAFDDEIIDDCVEAQLYSLKSNSWKMMDKLPDKSWNNNYQQMVYCKNALHCVTRDDGPGPGPGQGQGQTTLISAFNFGIEEYYRLQLPKGRKYNVYYYDTDLVAVKGCLHVVDFNPLDMSTRIWVMKEYGVTNSWTMLMILDEKFRRFQALPCAYTKDGKQIIIALLEIQFKDFIEYDVGSGKVKDHLRYDSQVLGSRIDILPWEGSVVPDPLKPSIIKRLFSWCKKIKRLLS